MKLLNLIIRVITATYFSSADPNLFGDTARRHDKERIANEYKAMATGTQEQIDQINSENPFESAGAKAAMAKASIGAKAMETRMLNTMGAGASPEALVAAQGETSKAIGSAAGNIAAGSAANKENRIDNLGRLKTQQMGMFGGMGSEASAERGTGWNTFFQGLDSFGKVASGGGQAAGSLISSGAV